MRRGIIALAAAGAAAGTMLWGTLGVGDDTELHLDPVGH